MTIAVAGCQSATPFELKIPGAKPISYDAIRNGSGVLGYAESLLGADLSTKYQVPVGPGASAVDPAIVAGAWELPLGTKAVQLEEALRADGKLGRPRDRNNGQIWIADYHPTGGKPVRLMLVDGNNPAFESAAVAAVRPGEHIYLIAYRIS